MVLFDAQSRQLALHTTLPPSHLDQYHRPHKLSHCPTCHRVFSQSVSHSDNGSATRSTSPSNATSALPPTNGFINPAYFAMLRQSLVPSLPPLPTLETIDSPSRQTQNYSRPYIESQLDGDDVQLLASKAKPLKTGISAQAFTNGYFETFFQVERELGRGSRGVVYLVKHAIDGVPLGNFACKRVPVGNDHDWLQKVLVEVQALQSLGHSNLVSYRYVWLEKHKINTFSPEIPCAFILQQYCNSGDLHDFVLGSPPQLTTEQLKERVRRRSRGQMEEPFDLSRTTSLPFDQIYAFFKDISSGLHHLHSHGFIHRDIKPSNCLLDNTNSRLRLLLSDFGEVQGANAVRTGSGATGTLSYCAPEVVQTDTLAGTYGNFSVKSDVFSLGMVVHFMCFAALPYSSAQDINEDSEDIDQLRHEILSWPGFDDARPRRRADLPEPLYKFLKRLLAIAPEERPTTDEILYGIIPAQDLHDWSEFAPTPFMDDVRNSRISSLSPPSPNVRTQLKRSTKTNTAFSTSPTIPAPSKSTFSSRACMDSPLVLSTSAPTQDPNAHTYPNPNIRPDLQPDPHPDSLLGSSSLSQSLVHARAFYNSAHVPHLSRLMSPLALLPAPASSLPPSISLALFKVVLFLLKYLSLTRPCRSLAPDAPVAYLVLTLAILDFTLPFKPLHFSCVKMPQWTLVLVVVHLFVITSARKWRLLCERPML